MSLKTRCTRATDGSAMFLLSIWNDAFHDGGGWPPQVYVFNREGTEDLIYQVTSAVRAYDNANKKTGPPPDDGGLVA